MEESLQELMTVPSIGKKMAVKLIKMDVHSISDLAKADPDDLYQKWEFHTGGHVDRCVLYSWRCAIYYARNTVHDPEKLLWWNWHDNKMDVNYKF